MISFPNSSRLIKGGIALLNPQTGAVLRIIALQYNQASPSLLGRMCRIWP